MGKLTKGWRKVRKGLHLTSKNKLFKGIKKLYSLPSGNSSAASAYTSTIENASNQWKYNTARTLSYLTGGA